MAQRVFDNLQRIQKLVPPRVGSAVFRSIFNGWTTARRSEQERYGLRARCYAGCGYSAEDSMEHYCRCPILAAPLRNKLHITLDARNGLSCFYLALPKQHESDECLIFTAIFIYASYMCSNHFRNANYVPTETVAIQYMEQTFIDVVKGDSQLTAKYNARWLSHFKL